MIADAPIINNFKEIEFPTNNMIIQLGVGGSFYKYESTTNSWIKIYQNYKLKMRVIDDYYNVIHNLELGYNINYDNIINSILCIEGNCNNRKIIEYLLNKWKN